MLSRKLLGFVLLFFASSCAADTNRQPIAPNNNESVRMELEKIYKKGVAGIPELIQVIEKNVDNQYNPDSYAAVNHSVRYLYMLAKRGVHTDNEVPVLIDVLKKQIHIKDTYLTAETIRIITGVDVGYSREFVNNYTAESETLRKEMISRWENTSEK